MSRGPVTEEGKRRSALNGIRHGLLAKCVVLENEKRENFEELFQQHIDRLDPQGGMELGFLEKMAAADWKLRRLWAIETQMFNDSVNAESDTVGELKRIESAFAKLAETQKFNVLQRYETRLDRIYHRQLRSLLELRKESPLEEVAEEEPGEPT